MTPTTNEITPEQANALAAVIQQIRPDWPAKQTYPLIGQHRTEYEFAKLCLAAVNAASKPTNRSPAVIFMPGSHWDIPDYTPAPPPPPACEDHPTYDAHNCTACWGDIKTGYRPENMLGKHFTPTEPEDAA